MSRTIKGKELDMAKLVQDNSDAVAVGNMQVNARGDVLGKGGEIAVKRDDVVREYYREEPAVTVEAPITQVIPTVSREVPVAEETVKKAVKPKAKRKTRNSDT